jgi:type IV pilus assembly protein PilY1
MTRWAPLEKDPKNPNGPYIYPNYNQFYDTSTKDGYEFIRDHIIGNKTYKIEGLIPYGGTPTTLRLNAVVRNTIINKLQYRCQKSYLVLLTDGLDVGTVPITDSTYYAGVLSYGYDGYFDGNRIRPNIAANIPFY